MPARAPPSGGGRAAPSSPSSSASSPARRRCPRRHSPAADARRGTGGGLRCAIGARQEWSRCRSAAARRAAGWDGGNPPGRTLMATGSDGEGTAQRETSARIPAPDAQAKNRPRGTVEAFEAVCGPRARAAERDEAPLAIVRRSASCTRARPPAAPSSPVCRRNARSSSAAVGRVRVAPLRRARRRRAGDVQAARQPGECRRGPLLLPDAQSAPSADPEIGSPKACSPRRAPSESQRDARQFLGRRGGRRRRRRHRCGSGRTCVPRASSRRRGRR